MKQSSASGFTLVEMAVVLLITALMLGAGLAMLAPWLAKAKINSTQSKLEHIADALSFYAQQHGRLPCPADPTVAIGANFGVQRTNGAPEECGDGSGTPGQYVGMVPFRDLGLNEESVMDGWGNPITYAPSKAVTTPAGNHGATADEIYNVCRQDFWIDPAGPNNINPNKARLCCPPETGAFYDRNDDVTVFDAAAGGDSMLAGVQREPNNPVNYGNMNVAGGVPVNVNNRMIAFVLFSHGMNGDGSFIPHTAFTRPVTAPAGSDEGENLDNDRRFVWRQYSTEDGNNYFDDLVLWRTNDQLISAGGKDSCARP